ncbi:MAG TPA: DUF981 domain-containing protein, partial [Rectinemataceae bacterium]|nr:DUF981 domain-containing protein [Rectinemataceae bacterium]
MFVDYLTVMLVNMIAGLVIMALFVYRYMDGDRKKVAPGLLMSGALALVTGLHMSLTWPLPGSYNIAFGEMAVLFGILFLFLGIASLADWELLTLAIYAVFAGVASIVIGIRIFDLKMTSEPLISAGGFVLTGLAAVISLPVYYLRRFRLVRILASLALLGGAAIWAAIGYLAYWAHLANFAKWAPDAM